MTVTDVRIPGQRQPNHDDTVTPESQRLTELETMLGNPDYAGFRAEIQTAIDDLRAATFVGDLAA